MKGYIEEVIKCAECGKEMIFVNGYISRKMHTKIEVTYSVCEKCHQKVLKKDLTDEALAS